MKIGPCKDETDLHIAFMPLALVLFWLLYNAFEIGTHSATEDALFLAVTIFLCAMLEVVCISTVVYFGRTITLDSEGCCFSFRGLEKKYRWEELDVQYCKNDRNYCYSHMENGDPNICASPYSMQPNMFAFGIQLFPPILQRKGLRASTTMLQLHMW